MRLQEDGEERSEEQKINHALRRLDAFSKHRKESCQNDLARPPRNPSAYFIERPRHEASPVAGVQQAAIDGGDQQPQSREALALSSHRMNS